MKKIKLEKLKPRNLAIQLIKFYKLALSPHKKPTCKYIPSCSQYAIDAFEEYNFFKALILTIWRILRCNPFSTGGYDPVKKNRNKYL